MNKEIRPPKGFIKFACDKCEILFCFPDPNNLKTAYKKITEDVSDSFSYEKFEAIYGKHLAGETCPLCCAIERAKAMITKLATSDSLYDTTQEKGRAMSEGLNLINYIEKEAEKARDVSEATLEGTNSLSASTSVLIDFANNIEHATLAARKGN